MEQYFRMNSSCELPQLQSLYSEMNLQPFFQWDLCAFCSGCSNSSSFKSTHLKLYMCKEIFRRMKADMCNKGSFKNPTHPKCMYSNPVLKYYSHKKVAHKDYWKRKTSQKNQEHLKNLLEMDWYIFQYNLNESFFANKNAQIPWEFTHDRKLK